MGKETILKYLSIALITLLVAMPICATGFIWFDWLLIVKIIGSLVWLAFITYAANVFIEKMTKSVESEASDAE